MPNIKAPQNQSLVIGIFSTSKSVSKSNSAAHTLLQNQKPKVQRQSIQFDIKTDVPKQMKF